METEADVAVVSSALRGFLSYLEANRAKFFTSKNYVEAGEDYISRAAQEAEWRRFLWDDRDRPRMRTSVWVRDFKSITQESEYSTAEGEI